MFSPDLWEFDITTARHEDMVGGGDYPRTRSRVVLSRASFPKWHDAAQTAGCLAVAVHGGMPIEILTRL